MASFRKECVDEYNIPKGIIHIEPNVKQIEYLIDNKINGLKKIENLIIIVKLLHQNILKLL